MILRNAKSRAKFYQQQIDGSLALAGKSFSVPGGKEQSSGLRLALVPPDTHEALEHDPLDVAHGIIVGLGISLILCTVIGLIIFLV